MQTNSENHETSRVVVISYVDAVVKNSKNFEHFVTYVDTNQDISTCDQDISTCGSLQPVRRPRVPFGSCQPDAAPRPLAVAALSLQREEVEEEKEGEREKR
jgi:hypothetical protein